MSKSNQLPAKIKYDDYIGRIKELCIRIDSDTNTAAIVPDFKYNIENKGLNPKCCEFKLSYDDIYQILTLEVEAWNRWNSKVNKLISKFVAYLNDEIINEMFVDMIKQAKEKVENDRSNEELRNKYGVPQVDYTLRT